MHFVKAATTTVRASARRLELDWLRTLVVLGLIPYHAAVVFAIGPGDYVKSPQRSLLFDLLATVVAFFGMPLLFLVAGAATWFALGRRTPARYALERVERLAVPFIFGVLALVPIQLYYDRRATPSYHANYLQFYRDFLVGWATIARHNVFGLGFQYWGHLWFIVYLLAVSLFLLPLLHWLRGPTAHKSIERIAARADRAYVLFLLLGAPFVIVEVALQGPIGLPAYADYSNLYSGPAGLALYAMAFVLGYLIYSEPRFQRAAVNVRTLALTQAVAMIALHEIALTVAGVQLARSPWGSLLVRSLRGYLAACLLIAILGIAQRSLAQGGPVLRYLNTASFPIYVLHMPILTVLGFYIVRWQAPIVVTFPALLLSTACATFALYEGIVRRVPLARFLFGLKSSGSRA